MNIGGSDYLVIKMTLTQFLLNHQGRKRGPVYTNSLLHSEKYTVAKSFN